MERLKKVGRQEYLCFLAYIVWNAVVGTGYRSTDCANSIRVSANGDGVA